jgi:hypothetical protein
MSDIVDYINPLRVPNFKEDGTVDFGLSQTMPPLPAIDIARCVDESKNGKADKHAYRSIAESLGLTGNNANNNDTTLTFSLSPEQWERYQQGIYTYDMRPINLADYNTSNGLFRRGADETWRNGDMERLGRDIYNEAANGNHIVQMSTYEFEQIFGVPNVSPIASAAVPGREEDFGLAMQYAHIARPGSQIYFFTDEEIAAIQAGAGFTAQPADVEFFDPKSGLFQSDAAVLGRGVNAALSARPGASMYLLTDADVAKFNGRDVLEVQAENAARVAAAEEEARLRAWEDSIWGKVSKVISEISIYTARAGNRLNELVSGEPPEPVQPTIVESDTAGLIPADLDVPVTPAESATPTSSVVEAPTALVPVSGNRYDSGSDTLLISNDAETTIDAQYN